MHRSHCNPHRCPNCSICPATRSMNDLSKEKARVRSRVYRLHAKGEIDTEEKKTILEEVKHLWTVSDVRSYYFHPNNADSRRRTEDSLSPPNQDHEVYTELPLRGSLGVSLSPSSRGLSAHLKNLSTNDYSSNMEFFANEKRRANLEEYRGVLENKTPLDERIDGRDAQRIEVHADTESQIVSNERRGLQVPESERNVSPCEQLPTLDAATIKQEIHKPPNRLCADNGGMAAAFDIIRSMEAVKCQIPTYRARDRARKLNSTGEEFTSSSPTLTTSTDSISSDNNDQDPDVRPPEYEFVFV